MPTEPSLVNACHSSKRFLQVPDEVILRYTSRPEVAAVFVLLARLSEVARGPIDLSRSDLPCWFDADRDDRIGVAIERALRTLRADGWLIHMNQGRREKRRLLPAWGRGRDGSPRPWRVDRPDRGRPERLRTQRVPLALIDHYLGRLEIRSDAPAWVERYVSQPLLSLRDLGVYMLLQLGNAPATTRLQQLGLVQDLPNLADFLEQVASGQLMIEENGAPVSVALSPAGVRRWRRSRAAVQPSIVESPDGSRRDPTHTGAGSAPGSQDSQRHLAPLCPPSLCDGASHPAWDKHGIKQQNKHVSSPHDSCNVDGTRGGVGDAPACARNTEQNMSAHIHRDSSITARELGHNFGVNQLVAEAHRLLNGTRVILPAEWRFLAHLQHNHGAAAVLTWQQRAASAGRTEIRLSYYVACAAQAAFAQCSSRTPILGQSPAPHTADHPVGKREPKLGAHMSALPHPAAQPSHQARATVLARIERQLKTPIRYPEKLAGVSLAVLHQWAAIAGHPGLRKWRDPMGFLVKNIAAGKAPPKRDELDRWAAAVGMHWCHPQRAIGADADDTAECGYPLRGAAGLQHPAGNGIHMDPDACLLDALLPPPAPTHMCDMSASVLPDGALEQVLREELRRMRPRAVWPVINQLTVATQEDYILIVCGNHQRLAAAHATLIGCIRGVLNDLGEQRPFRLVITAPLANKMPVPCATAQE